MRRRRARPEDQIQRAVFQHFKIRGAPGVIPWHSPNGGARRPIEAQILKGLGVRAGVSDICAVKPGKCPRCGFGPLGIFHAVELKAADGRPTEDQLKFVEEVNAAGGFACVVYGLDKALAVLEHLDLLRGKAT
jgi:hypothetical protein